MSSNLGWEELEPLLEGSPSTSQVLKLIHPLQIFAKNENLDTAQLRQPTYALLHFFTRTTDRKLRNDIVATLIAFLDKSPELLGEYISFLSDTLGTTPGTKPTIDYLGLLYLSQELLIYISKDPKCFEPNYQKLLQAHCFCTAGVEISINKRESARKDLVVRTKQGNRVRVSVLQSTIRTFTAIETNSGEGATCCDSILGYLLDRYASDNIPISGVIVIFGALAQCSLHMLSSRPTLHALIKEKYTERYSEFIGKEVILGKNPPTIYGIEVWLAPFLEEFVTNELFMTYFVPNLEKANLRTPEQGFSIASELYSHLNPDNVDLLNIFVSTKLMSQTISGFKSSKEANKLASIASVSSLLSSLSPKNTSIDDISKFVDEIFKNIKSNLNSEYKSLTAKLLVKVPTVSQECSSKIVTQLANYVVKEANETALNLMLNALFVHYFSLKNQDAAIDKIIFSGFNDKKPQVKKIWLTAFTSNSAHASVAMIDTFSSKCLEFIHEVFLHNQTHDPHTLLGCLEFMNRVSALGTSDTWEQIIEMIRTLPSTIVFGDILNTAAMSASMTPLARQRGQQLLLSLYEREPELVGLSVISSLEERIENGVHSAGDTVSFKFSTPVFNVLSRPVCDKTISENILLKLLPIVQYEKFNLKNGWAGLVLNGNLDPSDVVEKYSQQIVERAYSTYRSSEHSILNSCTLRSLGYVSFINSKAIVPLLIKKLKDDLSIEEVTSFTSEDIEIWHGEDGSLVIDVLEKQMAKKLANKNVKDYETLQWEAKVRKEQEKKSMRKLTREEQKMVDEQLAKEKAIRSKVQQSVLRILRGLELIRYLSDEAILANNGAEVWFPEAVSLLLKLSCETNIPSLVGEKVVQAFLALSRNVSAKLGSVRRSLGVAILRVYKVRNVSQNDTQELLEDLLSRVLFRVKFASNQTPLDPVSLSYLLPLLINVLEEGKRVAEKNVKKPVGNTEFMEEDKEEEHLMLAMEILSAHASMFQDPSIPRVPILSVLLSLLGLASKAKLAKDCLTALCRQISYAPTKQDLSVLLSSLLSPNSFVRSTVLEILDDEFELEPFLRTSPEIFICRFDSDSSIRETADFIWEFSKFTISNDLMDKLLSFFNQQDDNLRIFTASAFASGALYLESDYPGSVKKYLGVLMEFYRGKAVPLEAILDEFGLVVVPASERRDPWEERSTTAIALREIGSNLTENTDFVVDIIKFLVEEGPLGDRKLVVRQEMKEAGVDIITLHGAKRSEELIPIFEHALTSKIETTTKENVVILYGTLARHLDPDDPRIRTIVNRLLTALDTPSRDVQQAVSECIASLVFQFRSEVGGQIENLMKRLLDPSLPASIREGAAWGIAGLVKGYGIAALSEFDVIRNLMEAAEDKKEPIRRESVAYAFEYLSISLKKFFEPYVIEILPTILKNLGDSVPAVRNATAGATRSIMSQTTSYGVSRLIPVAVSNLNDISWRTKRGSVELLGNMAYLDPTQLSASLSTIVPEIVGVLNDSHKEVRKAADESLKRFGEVIRNPEIQKLVPVLIQAIGEPTKHTEDALDALIKTQFVHYIDGPSLALIIHVVHRGMHERSANTKRKACKIVGNMAILVDTKDLIPYLQQLVDEVEVAMVDPVPNTRATAAQALGALVERLGEGHFPTLIPRLLETLSDESKSGDRLGSAQALAEVISGIGLSKLEELLPTILAGVTSYRSYVRQGYMPLLLFLPICFGAQFAPYISQIIQPILAGLADENEDIHDTALRAGKLLIKNYATKAVDLLLPELERGMFDENERIRLSSVQLSGDLLFQVTGISSKNEFSEEEGDHSNELSGRLVEALGSENRDKVLASLFVCRNDTSGVVRATTVDIWKALVPNTPRTVREVLPVLTSMIVTNLASTSSTLRNIAAQTLGDMVRRVGGNALSQLLPTLEQSLEEAVGSDSRQGISIALHELIESSSAEALQPFQSIIVHIIRQALIDSDKTVRQAAAATFDSYQNIVGNTAIDEVIPYMLKMLGSSEQSENALSGLQDIMSTKSEVIFPILMPTLLTPPIDSSKAFALGSLAEVAGPALYKRLSSVINALVNTLIGTTSESQVPALQEALDKVFLSVTDMEGLHPLLQQILSSLKDDSPEKRVVVMQRLPNFFEHTVLDIGIYVPDFVANAILSLDDKDPRVVQATFNALSTLLKKQDNSMLEKLVQPAKQSLHMVGTPGEDLAAFKLPRGPSCILPIFLHGLMYGSNEEREESALAIADIVSKTPAANLKPFVSVITGPLIRVVGERFNGDIKAAILYTLNILFVKVPQFLRPFIPQLQRTFVKSLSDPSNETLRLRAAKALGSLIEYQPRIDPLVIELVGSARQATDEGIKTAVLRALFEVVEKSGSKLNENSKKSIVDLVEAEMLVKNDKLAVAYAKLIGALSEILTEDEAIKILREKILDTELEGNSGKFSVLTLNSFLRSAPAHIFNHTLVDKFVEYIISAINSEDVYFAENGIIAAGKMLLLVNEIKSPYTKIENPEPFILSEEKIKGLMDTLAMSMIKPVCNSTDCRRLSLVVARTLARFKYAECIEPYYDSLGPSIFSCLRDPVIPIKLAAEKAYLAVFRLVEEPEMDTFNRWFAAFSEGKTTLETVAGTSIPVRSVTDYTKRVGRRLASVERERIAAGGDAEAMFSDRFEDENEIWAVGGIELSPDV